MWGLPPSVRLFVATALVDDRKGPNSLMTLVRGVLVTTSSKAIRSSFSRAGAGGGRNQAWATRNAPPVARQPPQSSELIHRFELNNVSSAFSIAIG
jgi:hypothetical protein